MFHLVLDFEFVVNFELKGSEFQLNFRFRFDFLEPSLNFSNRYFRIM